jgi:hypothetical protein
MSNVPSPPTTSSSLRCRIIREQAIVFMRTLVRRLRQTNELLNRLDPRKRGLRGLLSDLQQKMSLDALDLKDEDAIRPYYAW